MSTERELPTTWPDDPSKFETVYRDHAPRIRTFLRQLVGYPQVAEDLTQEIFTQLWQRPASFDPTRGTLRAYLFGVARHRSIDWWRQTRPEDSPPEASFAAGNHERDLIISDALQRLPEEQRALLWLREVEGQSYTELATILDIPLGTVRSRLFAARQALRSIWLDQDLATQGHKRRSA